MVERGGWWKWAQIAEMIAKAKADAWDEGWDAGRGINEPACPDDHNPYLEGLAKFTHPEPDAKVVEVVAVEVRDYLVAHGGAVDEDDPDAIREFARWLTTREEEGAMTLTEFLLARIAEDEALASHATVGASISERAFGDASQFRWSWGWTVDGVSGVATYTTTQCPACTIARELTDHRDATAAEWGTRRAALNFARIVAERACPEYEPARTEEDA